MEGLKKKKSNNIRASFAAWRSTSSIAGVNKKALVGVRLLFERDIPAPRRIKSGQMGCTKEEGSKKGGGRKGEGNQTTVFLLNRLSITL